MQRAVVAARTDHVDRRVVAFAVIAEDQTKREFIPTMCHCIDPR